MYRVITTDGTELGITDSVLFIKISAEGTYIEASKDEAVGIAFEGVAYNLQGHTEVKNGKTVILVETSLEKVLKEQTEAAEKLQANMDYLAMMSEIDFDENADAEEGNE